MYSRDVWTSRGWNTAGSPELRTFCLWGLRLHLEPWDRIRNRQGPRIRDLYERSKIYRNLSKIYSKSSSNLPKISWISLNFWILPWLPSSSQKNAQDVLTLTCSFGCFHCSISSVKTSSLAKLAKGQGALGHEVFFFATVRGWESTEVWVISEMIFFWSFPVLWICVLIFQVARRILEPPPHFWNRKTTRTTCIMGVTTNTALLREELTEAKKAGWYSLKRNRAAAAIERWSSAVFCHSVSQAEVVSVIRYVVCRERAQIGTWCLSRQVTYWGNPAQGRRSDI